MEYNANIIQDIFFPFFLVVQVHGIHCISLPKIDVSTSV